MSKKVWLSVADDAQQAPGLMCLEADDTTLQRLISVMAKQGVKVTVISRAQAMKISWLQDRLDRQAGGENG